MFVACQNKNTRGLFDNKPRLYAYPSKPILPTSNEFIIIDSGAYGLSQRGKEIDAKHMFKLSNFYKKYGASNQFPVLGIAPDKFLDPSQTMRNYSFWMQQINHPVVPVIQFKKGKYIDFFEAKRQVDFYLQYGNKIFAISNPSLRASDAKNIKLIIDYMRKCGVKWTHNLGAGWNTLDCRDWFALGFNSIDSISYYTDAERGIEWCPASYSTRQSNRDIKTIMIQNYNLANNERTI